MGTTRYFRRSDLVSITCAVRYVMRRTGIVSSICNISPEVCHIKHPSSKRQIIDRNPIYVSFTVF